MRRVIAGLLTMFLLTTQFACGQDTAPNVSMRPVKITVATPAPPQPITPTANLRNLSNAEKAKAIQIALDTPEASAQINRWNTYKADLDWVGMLKNDSDGWFLYGLDYNVWEQGIPDKIPGSAVIYPRVSFYFGEPQELLLRVAIDLPTEKVVYIESYGEKSFGPPPAQIQK